MEQKRSYILMAIVFAVMMGWMIFLNKVVYPRHPEWNVNGTPPAATEPAPTQSMSQTGNSNSNWSTNLHIGPATNASTVPSTGPSGLLHVANGGSASASVAPVIIGSLKDKDETMPLAINLKPNGAAISSAILNEAKSVDGKQPYSFEEPYEGHDDLMPLATQSVIINGQTIDVGSVPWKLDASSTDFATFGLDIVGDGDKPVLHLSKTYSLTPRGSANPADGYELGIDLQATNLTKNALSVRIDTTGPTVPPREIERADDRQIISGYDRGDSRVYIMRTAPAEFKTKADTNLTVADKGYKFLWAGTSSVYFSAIVMPADPAQFDSIQARALNPEDVADNRQIVMDFQTVDLKLAANGSTTVPVKVFLGPKKRSLFESDYYGDFPRQFSDLLATSSGMCAFCAIPWLVDRLIDLLRFMHFILRDWGLAIIALVIIVRLILHPITKSSMGSTLKMQKMAPELERLKKKYGDDKEAFAKAQMGMYKEMGVTPILGCLPMLLQMPIWYALYSALQSEFSLRQAPFLWGWTWIHDLARPDRLMTWDQHPLTVPILGAHIYSLNLLPLLLAVVFFLQQKTQPQPPTSTPEQEQQRKMMGWMSMLFPLLMYAMPSGLILYIFTSSTFGILETNHIRNQLKKKEEEEKKGPVIIDAPKTNKRSDRNDRLDRRADEKLPEAKLGWWARIQQRAEELARENERTKRKSE